jgi:DNA-binding GntR family transcriptional regulator
MQPGVPKYRLLANLIRERILDGTYLVGDQLPTEVDWMQQTGYSRDTVRNAISVLRESGWVTVTHGLGMFVNPPEMRTNGNVDQGKPRQDRPPPPHIHRPH